MSDDDRASDLVSEFQIQLISGQKPSIEEYCRKNQHIASLERQLRQAKSLFDALHAMHQPHASRFLPGDRFAKYEILSAIGEGGMGSVYLAQADDQGAADTLFALKVLRRDVGAPRFDREVKALKTLNHPCIAQLVDAGTAIEGDAEQRYVVTRFVSGVSLRQLLDEQRQPGAQDPNWLVEAVTSLAPTSELAERAALEGPLSVVAELGFSLAEALEHAHTHGVMHRDLKPENIMLGFDGHVTLIDFGIATIAEDTSLTMPGVFVGSPGYASPEQILGRPTSPQTDVYGLGAVLFELLVRRAPFLTIDRPTTPPGPRDLISSIPSRIDTIVRRCLQPDPSARFMSMGSLAQALKPRKTLGAGIDPQILTLARSEDFDLQTVIHPSPELVSEDSLFGCLKQNVDFVQGVHASLERGQTGLIIMHESGSEIRSQVSTSEEQFGDAAWVIGRHKKCSVHLRHDQTVPLRHLWINLANATTRVVDLRTDHGFWVWGAGRVESISALGPLWLKTGRYFVGIVPRSTIWKESFEETWDSWRSIDVQKEKGAPAEDAVVSFAPVTQVTVVRPPTPLDSSEPEPGESLAGWIEVKREGRQARCAISTATLEQGVLMGRYARCEVGGHDLWADATVSRVHALLLSAEGGTAVAIYDLASHNGIQVNDKPTKAAVLNSGDQIKIGHNDVTWKSAATSALF